MTKLMIDIPSGWRYGFPRPFDKPKDMSMVTWISEKTGLSEEEVKEQQLDEWCRFWEISE